MRASSELGTKLSGLLSQQPGSPGVGAVGGVDKAGELTGPVEADNEESTCRSEVSFASLVHLF